MSGGTWDYVDRQLGYLADEIRSGADRSDEPLRDDLPAARTFAADILDELRDLLGELDHHFAGDSHLDDEHTWIEQARTRLNAAVAGTGGSR